MDGNTVEWCQKQKKKRCAVAWCAGVMDSFLIDY